jgi:hypothetical protein
MSRVIGPGVSSVGLRARMPNVLIRPIGVFNPVMPFQATGMHTHPPVLMPIAQGAMRAATATPEPDDEPPGARCVPPSQGFRGVPRRWFVPQPP